MKTCYNSFISCWSINTPRVPNDPGSLLPSELLGMPAESIACSLTLVLHQKSLRRHNKKNRMYLKSNRKKGYALCQFSLKKNPQNELSEVVRKADVI